MKGQKPELSLTSPENPAAFWRESFAKVCFDSQVLKNASMLRFGSRRETVVSS